MKAGITSFERATTDRKSEILQSLIKPETARTLVDETQLSKKHVREQLVKLANKVVNHQGTHVNNFKGPEKKAISNIVTSLQPSQLLMKTLDALIRATAEDAKFLLTSNGELATAIEINNYNGAARNLILKLPIIKAGKLETLAINLATTAENKIEFSSRNALVHYKRIFELFNGQLPDSLQLSRETPARELAELR